MGASRLTCAVASVCVAAVLQTASAAETVIALAACPKTGVHRACLAVPVHMVDDALGEKAEARSLSVSGRLKGVREKAFELRVARGAPTRGAPDGTVAYLGQSKRNRLVVLTNRGALEITRGARNALQQNTFVVKSGRRPQAVGRYTVLSSPTYVAQNRTLWIQVGGHCVSAPRSEPGLLTLNDEACTADNMLYAKPRITPMQHPDFDMLLNLLPELHDFRGGQVHENVLTAPDNGYDFVEVLSLNGTPYLIVRIDCDCDD